MPVSPVYNAIGWISEKMLKRKMRKEMDKTKKNIFNIFLSKQVQK